MDTKYASLVFSSGIDKLTEHNSSFDRGVLKVCYVGKNRNGSFISKETFERCMKSIYNCPIVCRYDREADEIGAHDVDVVRDDDGLRLINTTSPIGVIPESSTYSWHDVEEEDGTVHEYLFVDALIWKRQEAYRKIKENGVTDESMEITIKEGHMKDGVYVIDDFEFTAFCLLGTAKPCYESASLVTFSQDKFREQFAQMMSELKGNMIQPSLEVEINKNFAEGGNDSLEEKLALMAEFGLTEEMLDFSLEDAELEGLREKFEQIKATNEAAERERFALAEQFRNELCEALSEETITTEFGTMSRYWYMDYDAELNEVYCYDSSDWNIYGLKYEMNGDHVVIDFESRKRKKLAIVDFDDGEQPTNAFSLLLDAVAEKFTSKDAEWQEMVSAAEEKFQRTENELAELRQFKANAEKAADDAVRENVFSQFEDLAGDEAYESLRENNADYSVEELEEKCYALRGRKQSAKFALEPKKTHKLPVEKKTAAPAEPYGGIFVEFGTAGK